MSNITIPLHTAELLFVSLSVVVQELQRHTDYPTGNLETALAAYKQRRDRHVLSKGFTPEDIKLQTLTATEALTDFLEDKAGMDQDFDRWSEELNG